MEMLKIIFLLYGRFLFIFVFSSSSLSNGNYKFTQFSKPIIKNMVPYVFTGGNSGFYSITSFTNNYKTIFFYPLINIILKVLNSRGGKYSAKRQVNDYISIIKERLVFKIATTFAIIFVNSLVLDFVFIATFIVIFIAI